MRQILTILIALIAFFPVSKAAGPIFTSPKVITPATHQELSRIFHNYNYTWETLDKGAPPFILKSLPADLETIQETDQRKKFFFLSLLPMVLMANEEISRQREEVITILQRRHAGATLTNREKNRLLEIARKYGVKKNPLRNRSAEEALLKRVDILPASLVLAQAATESGYGTSRFALLGNNLFGEWTFTPGEGIVPLNRPAGETYEVRNFPSLYASLRSYMKNINTHPAYRALRAIRARLHAEGRPLLGRELAQGLINYSTRREEYVAQIQSVILDNRLTQLSNIVLRQKTPSSSGTHLPSPVRIASR